MIENKVILDRGGGTAALCQDGLKEEEGLTGVQGGGFGAGVWAASP